MQDSVVPAAKWVFDTSVALSFDDMLRRSIPQYDVMRQSVFDLGQSYATKGTTVDLGASRGESIAPFVGLSDCVAIETSPPMLAALRERFGDTVSVLDYDLRAAYPVSSSGLTLSILTLQFIPIEYRQRIIQDVYHSLVPSGAFILVEKVLGATSLLDKSMVDCYYNMKRKNNYTEEQIERKRLSLEGVLVPVTAKWNEELLFMAGFRQVDCFWRWMNFAAWIAIKV